MNDKQFWNFLSLGEVSNVSLGKTDVEADKVTVSAFEHSSVGHVWNPMRYCILAVLFGRVES